MTACHSAVMLHFCVCCSTHADIIWTQKSTSTCLCGMMQGSTKLWESLPAAIMDEAVRLHTVCMRRLILAHHGYESATEGDAFIIAFHTPVAALAFSVQLQEQLTQ